MGNKRGSFLIVFILIYSSFAHGFDGSFERRKFGSYTVSLSHNFESGLAKAVIKQRNAKVFEMSEIGDHYYFGNHFDEKLNGKDPYSGRDITGNSMPNLLISNWTGGAHCCNFLHIFELGRKLRKIATVEANSASIRLVDLDRDGIPEIEFLDGAIDYLFASYAFSPAARVVLKFRNDHYEVATKLMRKPMPTLRQVEGLRKRIRIGFQKEKSPELPYDFLKAMMDLSYSGHLDLALKIASEEWPENKPGLAAFNEKFVQALRDSHYWKDF